MVYRESIETGSYKTYCLLETKIIINVIPVFYCIDIVTICIGVRDVLHPY
jgi:hypothetical protein